MSATVLLIRHPESAWNREGIYQGQKDTPLSSLGKRQARLVAIHLSSVPLTGVISSPLRRARDLASAIAAPHGLESTIDERLTEIAHGAWEGLRREDVLRRWPDTYNLWLERPHEVTFPDGESLWDVNVRCLAPIEELLARPTEETWAVVTHDTCARLAVAAARGRPIAGFLSVSLENAGITTLQGPTLAGSIRSVNDVEHLGEHRVDLREQAL
jgi:probable phosphoglycerate mutase